MDERSARLGDRLRLATLTERNERDSFLRPDAVIKVTGAPETEDERVFCAALDGTRPLAGLSHGLSDDAQRTALESLQRRGAISLVGFALDGERAEPDIPAHVRAEIEAMIEEEQVRANAGDAFDDEPTVLTDDTSEIE